MSLKLEEITNYDDFSAVIKVEHEAYEAPLNSFWEILKGPSIPECTDRQWAWHKGTPGSRWIKVSDQASGEILGAAEWIFHKTNPFSTPQPPITGTWWPDGYRKDIADQMLATFFNERPRRMARPHALINICFVSQRARRRGAGKKMMEWGIKLADEMGLEAFVESTEAGRALYESVGFVAVGHIILDATMQDPTPEFTSLKDELLPKPFRVWQMWRPVGGKFVPGVTKYSWDANEVHVAS